MIGFKRRGLERQVDEKCAASMSSVSSNVSGSVWIARFLGLGLGLKAFCLAGPEQQSRSVVLAPPGEPQKKGRGGGRQRFSIGTVLRTRTLEVCPWAHTVQ